MAIGKGKNKNREYLLGRHAMNPILAEAEAVLFDMDGTLIDSKPVIEQAWCRIAKKYDVSIDREIIDEHIHGRSGEYTMNYLFKDFVHSQRADIKLEVDHIEETSPADLISGAREFLLLLRRNKIKTALVTASWQKKIDFLFALHNLHGLFDVVISCHDVQANPTRRGTCLRRTAWPAVFNIAWFSKTRSVVSRRG